MRSTITLASVFALLVLGALGCSEAPDTPQMTAPEVAGPTAQYVVDPCGTPLEPTLYAGQHIDTGLVSVYNDEQNVYIEITTTGGWEITESHVAVAPSLDLIPQTGSGNPKVGQFDLAAVHDPPVTSYIYTILRPGYTPAFIAVHAVVQLVENGAVVQEETAWADGEDFPGASWATYMVYGVQPCEEVIEGACCLYGAECILTTQAECEAQGGSYQGDYTTCEESDCTFGACCLPDGTCQILTEAECQEACGAYHGDYIDCDEVACPQPEGYGACLVGEQCFIVSEAECECQGGVYQGNDTSCDEE